MLLCHDQYDRTLERFPLAYLDQFAKTIPGKSVLPCHNQGGYWSSGDLPLGRFFKADIEKVVESEFPMLMRTGLAKALAPIPGFENKRKTVNYLAPSFYFANDDSTEGLRKNIDLGVYKHVSIGFSYDDLICDICGKSYLYWSSDGSAGCPHYRGDVLDDGRLVTLTFGGDASQAEALEGSIVYLGAQPGARLVKAIESGENIDPERLAYTPYGPDLVVLKEAERAAQKHNKPRTLVVPDLSDEEPTGKTLEDELAAALAAVQGATKRLEDYRQLRLGEGRGVSSARLEQAKSLVSELTDMVTKAESEDAPQPTGLPRDLEIRAHLVSKRSLLRGAGVK